jgi:hypothetical protein
MYKCSSTMVVSSHAFTVAAIELARRNNCKLIDKAALQQMDERSRNEGVEGFSRAYIAAAKGNWERAERLAAAAEDWGDSFVDLAGIRATEGDWEDAARLTEEAAHKGAFNAYLELAVRCDDEGRLDESDDACNCDEAQNASESGSGKIPEGMTVPEWEQRMQRRISLLGHRSRWYDAEQIVHRAPKSSFDTLFNHLFIQRLLDDDVEAKEMARIPPNPGPYLNGLAMALAAQSRWEEAELLADEAAKHGVSHMQDFLDSATSYEVLKRRIEEEW